MSLTAAATMEILFDVEGYTATKEMAADGECYQSEMFSICCYDWAVRYYPESGDPFISVVLVLLSKPKDSGRVAARFQCAMVDSFGEPSTEVSKSSSYVFSSCGMEQGFWEYDTKDVLNGPDFLVGDCFTLSCIVAVLKKHQGAP